MTDTAEHDSALLGELKTCIRALPVEASDLVSDLSARADQLDMPSTRDQALAEFQKYARHYKGLRDVVVPGVAQSDWERQVDRLERLARAAMKARRPVWWRRWFSESKGSIQRPVVAQRIDGIHGGLASNAFRTVAIVLSTSEHPIVYSVTGEFESELVLEDEVFRDSGSGDWLGFYDWLRSETGEIVGVRLWVDSPNEFINAAAASVNVVAAEGCMPLLIYLGETRDFDEAQSDDQGFGCNRLLLSASRFALTFQVPHR